jgi:hypothetical protein
VSLQQRQQDEAGTGRPGEFVLRVDTGAAVNIRVVGRAGVRLGVGTWSRQSQKSTQGPVHSHS